MRKRNVKKIIAWFCVAAVVVAAALVVGVRRQWHKRGWFVVRQWWHADTWRHQSLWLDDYRVVIEALPVEGVERNLSGLTWNGDTGTLFAVVNRPPLAVELSTEGKTLRIIRLVGFDDPEAIEYIGESRYIIADERPQKIIAVAIAADTAELKAADFPRVTLGRGLISNEGLEGLAWDFSARRLYAANERNPVHIYEVAGFPQESDALMDIEVTGDPKRDRRLFVTDLASLDFNAHYQHLLVLSEESKRVIEIDKDGHPISSMSLAAGHGLSRPVPQPEGMAMDDQNNLYIVSEPNLFYLFKKPDAP